MPTKPEGPAQEPQVNCTCEHPDLDCEMHPATLVPSKPASLREAVEQLRAIPAAWKERPDPLAELHEIRYGSQPAGAREKNWLVEAVENCPDPVLKQNCKQLLGNDYTNAAVQFIADAQTAAKHAEIAELKRQLKSLEKTMRLEDETTAAERKGWTARAEDAERERDSLREQLRTAEEAFDRMATCEDDESEEYVTAWDALGAALKAGKDGQQ